MHWDPTEVRVQPPASQKVKTVICNDNDKHWIVLSGGSGIFGVFVKWRSVAKEELTGSNRNRDAERSDKQDASET